MCVPYGGTFLVLSREASSAEDSSVLYRVASGQTLVEAWGLPSALSAWPLSFRMCARLGVSVVYSYLGTGS